MYIERVKGKWIVYAPGRKLIPGKYYTKGQAIGAYNDYIKELKKQHLSIEPEHKHTLEIHPKDDLKEEPEEISSSDILVNTEVGTTEEELATVAPKKPARAASLKKSKAKPKRK